EARKQALASLLEGKDAALPPVLHQLLDDAALRGEALRGLARYNAPETPREILARYKTLSEQDRSDAVTTLASRPTYALALLDAVASGAVPRGDVSAFTAAQIARLGDEKTLARLNSAWGTIRTSSAEKQQQIAEFKRLLTPAALAEADASKGRALFDKTCAKCHKLFGEGGQIGPDITGSNRANVDYLLENLLDPSAVVGRDYQMTSFILNDGRVLAGLIRQENDATVVLQTQNEAIVIAKEDVDERSLSPLSMMPENQLQQLAADEVRDLAAYLASGSQVPLPGQGPWLNPQTGRVAGAVEGESIAVAKVDGGATRPQEMGGFAKARWSGGRQLWWTGAKPGDRLTLKLSAKHDGKYELFTVLTKARDSGVVRISLDDAAPGPAIDLFHPIEVVTTGALSLGTHALAAGEHRVTVEITGAHPDAVKAYMFGLDYLLLVERP
ncbi:MAG: c-type cytochrome, partial [Planctomycetales bacterium]|nr:c-type cytochrome [Planctomycetales bacterium]